MSQVRYFYGTAKNQNWTIKYAYLNDLVTNQKTVWHQMTQKFIFNDLEGVRFLSLQWPLQCVGQAYLSLLVFKLCSVIEEMPWQNNRENNLTEWHTEWEEEKIWF